MYDNPGTRVKDISSIFLGIGAVTSLLLFILVWHAGGPFGFLTGFITAAITMGMTYVNYLLLCAFGELVESNSILVANSKLMLEQLSKLRAAPVAGTAAPVAGTTAPAAKKAAPAKKSPAADLPKPASVVPDAEGRVKPIPADNGTIICPCCNTVQRAGRTRCFGCGREFILDD